MLKFTALIMRRPTEHVSVITSISWILRARTFWRLAQLPADSTTSALAAALVFGRSSRPAVKSPDERSIRLKRYADPATQRGLSLRRKKSKTTLAGGRNSSRSTPLLRAPGNGTRNSQQATKSKTVESAVLSGESLAAFARNTLSTAHATAGEERSARGLFVSAAS